MMKKLNKIIALILAMAMCMVCVPAFAITVTPTPGGPSIGEEVGDWDGFDVVIKLATSATFILAEREDSPYEKDCKDSPNNGTEPGAIVVTTAEELSADEWAGEVYEPRIQEFQEASFKITNNGPVKYNIVAAEGYTLIQDEEDKDKYTIKANDDNENVSETKYRQGLVIGYIEYLDGYGESEIKATEATIKSGKAPEPKVTEYWNFQYNVPAPKATFILAERAADKYDSNDPEPNKGDDGFIVVTSGDDDPLENFTSASFSIDNVATDGSPIEYEIVAAKGYALLYYDDTKTYEIHVKPEDGDDAPAVTEKPALGGIVIGYLKYPGGYGKGTITPKEVRITTELPNNLCYELARENITVYDFGYEVEEKTQDLTVTVDFNNDTETNNIADYQKMILNVYSARLGDITIKLGNDVTVDDREDGIEISVEATDNKYTVDVTNLPAYDTYTVSIKGDGYRTAKTYVNLNENKTVLFWNNAKDAPASHVTTTAGGTVEKSVTTNFLAGDIIMDGKIDLYDLSAVSSYFGKGTGSEEKLMTKNVEANAKYIQYDLNRDGVVDILDIAIVIDGWAK